MIVFFLILLAALAQEAPVPDLNAQLYRPVVDARATLWTDDAGQHRGPELYTTARMALQYVHRPFAYVGADGTWTEVVSDVVQLDAIGALAIDRFRLGFDVPAYLYSAGQLTDDGAGLADLALDARVTLLDGQDAPLGLALGGRATVPTTTVPAPLGQPGVGGDLQAILDRRFGDRLLLATNLGVRLLPATRLPNLQLDDQVFVRIGAGYELSPRAGLSGDLAASGNLTSPFADLSAVPVEAMVGGWARATDALVARAGVGRGLTPGIGAPVARGVFFLAYERDAPRDTDEDGLVDKLDPCPREPEDVDGYEDADGCPDPSIALVIEARGPDGQLVRSAETSISGPAANSSGGFTMQVDLHPGSYVASVTAPGFYPGELRFQVPPPSGVSTLVVSLEPEPVLGTLSVAIVDEQGAQVRDAIWVVDDHPGQVLPEGTGSMELPPGVHALVVVAEGFVTHRLQASVALAEVTEEVVVLRPASVRVTREKIEISDKVYFETGRAVIKTESEALLTEVAGILLDNPHILRVRVEGHTDSRGSASSNLALSDRRAAAVRAFLIEQGVEPNRLESAGYGESTPIDHREVPEAWEANRRVEFVILEQAE